LAHLDKNPKTPSQLQASYLVSENIFFLKKIVCEAGKGSRKNISSEI
jgi:hypothetical protein